MITVFTSCYNQSEFLGEAIESVLAQTNKDFEYLLYDDGSEDNTWNVIKKYAASDPRIKAVKLEKQPCLSCVINRSVKDAAGKYWVWAPADDTLEPGLLYYKAKMAERFPDDVIYSWGKIIGTEQERMKIDCTPEEFREIVKTKSPIGFTGIWIPTNTLRLLPFPENVRYVEDFCWMLLACKLGVSFRAVPQFLYWKRKWANSSSFKLAHEIHKEVDEVREMVAAL